LLPSNDKGIHRQVYRRMRPTIFLLLRVFVAQGTRLPFRCLAMKGGIHFTEPLPSNDRRDTHTDTETNGRDLGSMLLRWAQMSWYTYQIS
jgi:hypothetical protein